ncbi:MAG: SDR family oxidoreductase [Chitinophagaceae bacterium]|nr:SDR family oxidoreductase [Chitinophagaceae bacterium]
MSHLKDAFGIITGVAEGLGNKIARAYGREGMRLALMDVQTEKLNELARELTADGIDCLPISVDLSDASQTQKALQKALDHYGTPRVLLHNAAVLNERLFIDITFEQWRKEIDIILQAGFILSKGVWPLMMDAGIGSIIFISSGSGLKGFVKEAAYCPGKHGQEGLMKVLSMEGKPFNIAVNTVTTGVPINTPMSHGHYPEELRKQWVDPALLTPAFVWLAKQDTSFATGERLDAWKMSQLVTGQ